MMIVFVAGHDDSDMGASAPDYTTIDPDDIIAEHTLSSGIASEFNDIIFPEEVIVDVVNDDEDLPLSPKISHIISALKRVDILSERKLVVALHIDWKGAGSGAFAYYKDGDKKGQELAAKICKDLSKEFDYPFRAVRKSSSSRFSRLGIIDDIQLFSNPENGHARSVLIEMGSLGHDLDMLKNRQAEIANVISSSILEFYNPPDMPNNNTVNDYLKEIDEFSSKIWGKADIGSFEVIDLQSIRRLSESIAQNKRVIQGMLGLKVTNE